MGVMCICLKEWVRWFLIFVGIIVVVGDWIFFEKMYFVCFECLYIFDGLLRVDYSLLMVVVWIFYICGGLLVKYLII